MNSLTILRRAALLLLVSSAFPACDGGSGTAGINCPSPTSLVVARQPTGVDRCANGTVHVLVKLTCPSPLPRSTTFTSGGGSCTSDADCKDAPHGYCTPTLPSGATSCFYGCVTDEECGAGKACVCGDPVGQCMRALCKSDGDCGELSCMSYTHPGDCGPSLLACHTPQDRCQTDRDCPGFMKCAPTLDGAGPWACQTGVDCQI